MLKQNLYGQFSAGISHFTVASYC